MTQKEEIGALANTNSRTILAALREVRIGEVFDLDPGRFRGMPLWPGHPAYELLTFRTPAGLRVGADQPWLAPDRNPSGAMFMTELMIASQHTGAHVDALAHWTRGDETEGWSGFKAAQHLSDFGPERADIAKAPPIITRAVLLDVAGAQGVQRLQAGEAVEVADLKAAMSFGAVDIEPGDSVLVRTGLMSVWPDRERVNETDGAGLTLESAQWLVEKKGAIFLASDTSLLEQGPSSDPQSPAPVHVYLLIEKGILIGEFFYLEDLADKKQYRFTLIVLPLKLKGGTASMVRPIALI